MSINLANAPVSWGVDYAEDPKNPPWEKVMTEIADAGYRHTELGPYADTMIFSAGGLLIIYLASMLYHSGKLGGGTGE